MSLLSCCLWLVVVVVASETASCQETTLVSVDSNGAQGNGGSYAEAISADGRFVAFNSLATNLVPNDNNHRLDVFVHDRPTGTTERVSISSSGAEADLDCYGWSISADGRFVSFSSWATTLVSGDTNKLEDVFVHDRVTGTTELVSLNRFGGLANGVSYAPSLSSDSRFVAFYSDSSNLVAGDNNFNNDVFVRDRQNGTTELISVDSSGNQGNGDAVWPAISADGTIIVFSSDSTNLVPGDTNGLFDVFVHDRSTGVTERVSVDSSGNESNGDSNYPSISADGLVVAFESLATNLTANDNNGVLDVFVHDRGSGATECVSLTPAGFTGDNQSRAEAGISADGRFVAFTSWATDIDAGDGNGDPDAFVRDRATGTTELASVDSSGNQGNGVSYASAMSADGESIALWSGSTNLVPNDTNGLPDVFVHDRCDAIWLNYDNGVPGTLGVPGFTAQSDPVLGSTLSLDLDNSYGGATFGLLFVGLGRAEIPTTWGGELLVAPVLALGLALPAGVTTLSGQIPNDPSLCQVTVDIQVFEADPGAVKGVSFTPGLELILGN